MKVKERLNAALSGMKKQKRDVIAVFIASYLAFAPYTVSFLDLSDRLQHSGLPLPVVLWANHLTVVAIVLLFLAFFVAYAVKPLTSDRDSRLGAALGVLLGLSVLLLPLFLFSQVCPRSSPPGVSKLLLLPMLLRFWLLALPLPIGIAAATRSRPAGLLVGVLLEALLIFPLQLGYVSELDIRTYSVNSEFLPCY